MKTPYSNFEGCLLKDRCYDNQFGLTNFFNNYFVYKIDITIFGISDEFRI